MPREPSTPRIAVWRKLKRLGVAQLGDGLVALPADAHTHEQVKWVAEEIEQAGGSRCGGRLGRTLRRDLVDPVLWKIAEVVHEADLEDDRFDAPDAVGLDVVLRGLSLMLDDASVLAVTEPVFDGLDEHHSRAVLLGRPPA